MQTQDKLGEREEREEREERDRGHKSPTAALQLFRARAKAACGTFSSVNEWYEFLTRHLEPVLKEYEDTLSADIRDRLHDAAKVSKAGRDGINEACHTLDRELGTAIEKLVLVGPEPGSSALLITITVIAVVVAGAVLSGIAKGVGELVNPTVEVSLINRDCQPGIPIAGGTFAGISIPTRTLRVGESLKTKVPDGLSISVGATKPAIATVQLLLVSRSFELPGSITRLDLKGKGVPPTQHLVTDFSTVFRDGGAPYDVGLSCRR